MAIHLLAPKETVQLRKVICNTCEFSKNNICQKCKCLIPIKVTFSKANCPVEKWKAVEDGEIFEEIPKEQTKD